MKGWGELVNIKYTIKGKEGIHASPAKNFCQTAMKFNSNIVIRKDDKEYQAKSILSVLCMGAVKGEEIEVVAEGIDEQVAVEELTFALEEI